MIKVVRFLTICMIGAAFAASSIAWAYTTHTAVNHSGATAASLNGGPSPEDTAVYTAVNYPGATATSLNGGPNLEGTAVGTWTDSGGVVHGLTYNYNNGHFTSFDPPGSTITIPNFINLQGVIVGQYFDSAGSSHGFVLNRGTYTTVNYPDAPGTELTGINDLGEMSGAYCSDAGCDTSATLHSFVRSRSGVFTSFDPPGATGSSASTVSLAGAVVGSYDTTAEPTCSTVCQGYLQFWGRYTTINYPGATFTFGGGGNVWNNIVGLYLDAEGNGHGFLWSNGAYTSFDYPGAAFTDPSGINALGVIVGIYFESSGVEHGFIRKP